MANSVKEREINKKSMKGSQFLSSIRLTEESKIFKEEFLNNSVIKSTCDGEQTDLGGCKVALGKEKIFEGLF